MTEDGSRSYKVLRVLNAVRLRPAMYVGDVCDGSGLHRLIELAALDALARRPARVVVTLRDDGTVEVADDGAPFPVPAESMLTQLMRYDPGHLALVNALSSRFEARLGRGGGEERLAFADGHLVSCLVKQTACVGAMAAGDVLPTVVAFLASRDVFGAVAYDRALVVRQLRDLSRREPGALLALVEPPASPLQASL